MAGKVCSVITGKEARDLLKSHKNGKFFTVVFVKRTNGEERTMNCRKGVLKGTRGGGLRFDPTEKNLIGVFDIPKGQHRFIALEDLRRININGLRYVVKN